jgi:CRISPR/Cas system-associated exonuclease Cas4 (RecB family)
LVGDLKEHLPELWSKVEEWERAAANCEDTWADLAKQAQSKGIAQDLFELGLRAGLLFLSEVGQKVGTARIPFKLETASDVGVWLLRTGGIREYLELFRQQREQLEAAYVELENLLNPLELPRALLERQCKHCPLA